MVASKLTHRAKVARKCNAYVICAGNRRIEAGALYIARTLRLSLTRIERINECAECVAARAGWDDHAMRVNRAKADGRKLVRCDVYEDGARMGVKSPRTGRVLWVATARVPGWMRKAVRLACAWKNGKGGVGSQLYYMLQEDPSIDPRFYTAVAFLPEDLKTWLQLSQDATAEVA